jgi:endonuclease/exonuclease/phosphatase family metal-dependent hydrolase
MITGTTESEAVVPLKDAFHHSVLPHHGALNTFSGFAVKDSLAGPRIDYIFVRSNIAVLKHGILTDFQEGTFPSDHLPVIAQIVLP